MTTGSTLMTLIREPSRYSMVKRPVVRTSKPSLLRTLCLFSHVKVMVLPTQYASAKRYMTWHVATQSMSHGDHPTKKVRRGTRRHPRSSGARRTYGPKRALGQPIV